MSLYCKGTACPKSQECLRAEAYRDLVAELRKDAAVGVAYNFITDQLERRHA